MFCQKCGAKNDDNAKFCQKCGAALNQNSIPQNSSFFKNNKVLIVAIALIICVCGAAGAFVLMNSHSGPQLYDYDMSEFIEGGEYVVSLVDENGTPMKGKQIELICYNDYGGSVTLGNSTDYEGKTSFRLDFLSGTYKIDVIYTDEDIPELGWRNVTQFSKTITIKDGPNHQSYEKFIEKNKDYVVYDANIKVNSGSYAYDTLTGWDEDANQYMWYGGAWFHEEDIQNGYVEII